MTDVVRCMIGKKVAALKGPKTDLTKSPCCTRVKYILFADGRSFVHVGLFGGLRYRENKQQWEELMQTHPDALDGMLG